MQCRDCVYSQIVHNVYTHICMGGNSCEGLICANFMSYGQLGKLKLPNLYHDQYPV